MAEEINVRRGDFVVLAAAGDYGKPRPALIVQSDIYSELASVTYCPLTSTIRKDFGLLEITVDPHPTNGLQQVSQVAIEKIATIPRTKIGKVIGRADDELMQRVIRALAAFLEIV
jgi:mRNA interferase MazF